MWQTQNHLTQSDGYRYQQRPNETIRSEDLSKRIKDEGILKKSGRKIHISCICREINPLHGAQRTCVLLSRSSISIIARRIAAHLRTFSPQCASHPPAPAHRPALRHTRAQPMTGAGLWMLLRPSSPRAGRERERERERERQSLQTRTAAQWRRSSDSSSHNAAPQRDNQTGNNMLESEQPVSDEEKLRCGLRSQKHLQDGENRQADDGAQSECSDQTDEMIQTESHWETEQ
ncbi:hypothetical protein DPX16_4546 [Anabarilius grahami]|uniref:Uncharacterized protein n=1 Tax=Anabarilius grahami TaxID=495550 RepID=A0A3N0YBX4_ANAGA|nr:hypothetical protein DPX16_4546 [Anabarilius grahami]